MKIIRVTLDTNVLDTDIVDRVKQAANGLSIELANITVSVRELEGTSIKPLSHPVLETAVWDESRWGESVWAEESDNDLFEKLLSIVSNGAFPRRNARQNLTNGQRHQMRDVLILASHKRDGRDILITNEKKAFIGKSGLLRNKLESVCSTRIMNVDEFITYCNSLRAK